MTNMIETYAAERGMTAEGLRAVAKASVFKYCEAVLVTDSQIEALIAQAKALGADPINGEIRAVLDERGAARFYLTVDGYLRAANEHPQMDGLEIILAPREEWTEIQSVEPTQPSVSCPAWVAVRIYRKDRRIPFEVREYLDECRIAPVISKSGTFINSQWMKTPKRLLINKAVCTAVRFAFGIGGAFADEADENRRTEPDAQNTEKKEPAQTTKPARTKKAAEAQEAKSETQAHAAEAEPDAPAKETPDEAPAQTPKESAPQPEKAEEKTPDNAATAEEQAEVSEEEENRRIEERKHRVDKLVDEVIARMKAGKATLEQAQNWAQKFPSFTPVERSAVLGRIAMAAVAAAQ